LQHDEACGLGHGRLLDPATIGRNAGRENRRRMAIAEPQQLSDVIRSAPGLAVSGAAS
jgi:hypothetical protein